jgi:hypothetical protein
MKQNGLEDVSAQSLSKARAAEQDSVNSMWISAVVAKSQSKILLGPDSAIGLFSNQHFSQMVPAQEEFQ